MEKRDCLEHFNTKIDFLNYHLRDQDDDKNTIHIYGPMIMKTRIPTQGSWVSKIKKWKFDGKIANPKEDSARFM